MIIWVWLITSRSDGSCCVIAFHYLRQVLCQQRLYRQLAVLGKCGCVMTCIEYKVGLLETERVGISRRPLFQHLIANAPHQYARMVTVTPDEVGKVSLVPFVKEACIVVLSLLSAPHVKALIHDNQSHGVAHGEQFWCRRIVRASYGVDTHCLQLCQFAVHGVLRESRTKTSEVVMFAHSVDLEVLAIKPESRLTVKTEVTESRHRRHLVYNLAIFQQLSLHLIYI